MCIRDRAMIEVAERFEDYQMVLAGAPSIDDAYYEKFIKGTPVKLVRNKTYPLLSLIHIWCRKDYYHH